MNDPHIDVLAPKSEPPAHRWVTRALAVFTVILCALPVVVVGWGILLFLYRRIFT